MMLYRRNEVTITTNQVGACGLLTQRNSLKLVDQCKLNYRQSQTSHVVCVNTTLLQVDMYTHDAMELL